MNSLSIITSHVDKVIGTTPPTTPSSEHLPNLRSLKRSSSESDVNTTSTSSGYKTFVSGKNHQGDNDEGEEGEAMDGLGPLDSEVLDEKIGLLALKRRSLAQRVIGSFMDRWIGAIRWLVSTITMGVKWIVSFVYDERGRFSPLQPAVSVARVVWKPSRRKDYQAVREKGSGGVGGGGNEIGELDLVGADEDSAILDERSASARSRFKDRGGSISSSDSPSGPRRSIRIKLYNEASANKTPKPSSLKSPPSTTIPPNFRLTKYPRCPSPSRPLLNKNPAQKTLILDLDETLIHSLAKGGRMSSGHMVEVKLDRQHAILYYVHKRPYCDEFLRKVSKWYNLVVFTASVQEYADPVIDWLEQDRKYFAARYYRQHCTNRGGAYVKDLSFVEPDLSKVAIVDNSPISYIFHEDNGIPIEGWINDPTDMDLLNLIPLLQAMHYVNDVRSILSMRMGELIS